MTISFVNRLISRLYKQHTEARLLQTGGGSKIMEELVAILYLEPISETLTYRPYLDQIENKRFIDWYIDRFKKNYPDVKLHIIVRNDLYGQEVATIAQSHKVGLTLTNLWTPLGAIMESLCVISQQYIALVNLEMALAPSDLLLKTLVHHLGFRNECTLVSGLPDGCVPEIYDRSFLESLGLLNSNAMIQKTPRQIVENLVSIQQSKQSCQAYNGKITLVSLPHRLTAKEPFLMKTKPYNAGGVYQADKVDLPHAIHFCWPSDIEIAREILMHYPSGINDDLKALALWKQISITKENMLRQCWLRESMLDQRLKPNSTRHRIMYVSASSAFSGGEESLTQLVSHLDRRVYDPIAFIGLQGYFSERLKQAGAQVVVANCDFVSNSVDSYLYLSSKLKEIKPDLIHCNDAATLPLILAAIHLGIPIVQHLRTTTSNHGLYVEAFKAAKAAIAVSDFIRREALKFSVPREQFHVIYNGVDLDTFYPQVFDKIEMRRYFNIPPHARVALMIARYAPNKRHDLMIKAARVVAQKVPSFHLVLAGESYNDPRAFEVALKQLNDSKLADKVTLLPFQLDIRRIKSAADVLVSCSDQEPLARCVIEAMAIGLPIVTTDSGGNHEVIQDGFTGFVVRGGDYEAIAEGIVKAFVDDAGTAKIALSARKYAEDELSIEKHVSRITAVYNFLGLN